MKFLVTEYTLEMNYEAISTILEFEKKGKSFVFKFGHKQIYIFEVKGEVFAVDNRCPHEGYPLSEGTLETEERDESETTCAQKKCVLTCNWHNWKFNVGSGECLVGQDHIRTYPVKITDGVIYIDISDLDKEEMKIKVLNHFKEAFLEHQYARMSRELIRAKLYDFDMMDFVKEVIFLSYQKFEFGMGHAFAGLADWLTLYYESKDLLPEATTCLLEAFDHFSYDILRERDYPFSDKKIDYDEKRLILSVENENEEVAIACLNDVFERGLSFSSLTSVFTYIALEHYNDFGHSLIYVYKSKQISETLKDLRVDRCLALSLVRSFIFAKREDLTPEFSEYKIQLERFNKIQPPKKSADYDIRELLGSKVKKAMAWVTDSAHSVSYDDLFDCLLMANGHNMLYFKSDYQNISTNPVTQNKGWLDFTHGITFSNAVRSLCANDSHLWKKGLLQMACFYGRNTTFTLGEIDEKEWEVVNPASFLIKVKDILFDHGVPLPIFSVHYLKTTFAVIEELDYASDECKNFLLMALNRFIHSPIKQKYVRRTVLQNISLIKKDF